MIWATIEFTSSLVLVYLLQENCQVFQKVHRALRGQGFFRCGVHVLEGWRVEGWRGKKRGRERGVED